MFPTKDGQGKIESVLLMTLMLMFRGKYLGFFRNNNSTGSYMLGNACQL